MTNKNNVFCPTMVTINTAAELTGVSYSFIRRLCLTNQIVYVKTGCKYLINLERFVAFLNGENVRQEE